VSQKSEPHIFTITSAKVDQIL